MNDSEAQSATDSDKKKQDDGIAPREPQTTSAQDKNNDIRILPEPETDPSSASSVQPKAIEVLQDGHDSDAETVVLPGKDGYSPSKIRKVRQEDHLRLDRDQDKPQGNMNNLDERLAEGSKMKPTRQSMPGDVGRLKVHMHVRKDGSSGLSSAPSSPSGKRAKLIERAWKQARGDSDGPHSSSSDESAHSSSRMGDKPVRQKFRNHDRLLPQKRKAQKTESDDEHDSHKPRRLRTTSIGLDGRRGGGEGGSKHTSRIRSPSPRLRQHRRSVSNHTPSNGQPQRRKRQSTSRTDYQSDDSSVSGSPQPRTLRRLIPPSLNTSESINSPAKVGPHKKHLDAHGQTFLARACARGEFEGAKTRLGERPEDLNVADYAGNTPLQIAALHGSEDIVKLLIDAGCNLDCVNYDKETPLLDAVDNGHLGVVKLLLDAGVNPRKANVNGEEPIDRVTEDTENAEEIKHALKEAKRHSGQRHRTSEERYPQTDQDMRDSNAPESPRRSPTASGLASAGRRGGTVRSTKTRNDLLYMPLDEKTLRQAAGRGDEETVARILQVKESSDDPESMVAAARGGHDLVIQLLLGLGGANPDPAPVNGLPPEFATPILAAIGQENIKVVELLLEQQGFDPTRKFKAETYHEIARRRQGTNWKEEEQLLKTAYDAARRGNRKEGGVKAHKSPGRREEKRIGRDDTESSKMLKRNPSSPSREAEIRKRPGASKVSSPKEKRRPDSLASHPDDQSQRHAVARAKRDDKAAASDREYSPGAGHKAISKRMDSDVAYGSSDGDMPKPRRKLISKAELRGERIKIRRASVVSNPTKEPSNSHDSRNDDLQDTVKQTNKLHDHLNVSERGGSKDRDGFAKRHRPSLTPEESIGGKDDGGAAPIKKRRLESQDKEKRAKRAHSLESKSRKVSAGDDLGRPLKSTLKQGSDEMRLESERGSDVHRSESGRPDIIEHPLVRIKSEDVDVEMPDVPQLHPAKDTEIGSPGEVRPSSAKTQSDERRDALQHDKLKTEEVSGERSKEEAKPEARRRHAEEQARLQKEEQVRLQKEEEERKRFDEETALREEQEMKQRRLAEAKKREEEEEAKARKQHEEDERLRKEQVEREAEIARRLREEERKQKEQLEKLHREEMEKRRAAREQETRRAKEAEERSRLDKLPALLRWLDQCADPKMPALAEKFNHLQGVRYDTIDSRANGTVEGREQWILNIDAALVLGEKDLGLSRYTAWERAPVTELAKRTIWNVDWPRYTLDSHKFWDLGRQLEGYYGEADPASLDFETRQELKRVGWLRFRDLSMFFVKLSDLLYTVPNVPHLRNMRLAVEYREIYESEDHARRLKLPQKWKEDPGIERYHGFAPRHNYYMNGQLTGEELPTLTRTSKMPFNEVQMPRRGLMPVATDDPDYGRLCLAQGLGHLIEDQQGSRSSSPLLPLPNGSVSAHSSLEMKTDVRTSAPSANGHRVMNGSLNGTYDEHVS